MFYFYFAGPSKKLTIVISDNLRSCNVKGREYPLGRHFSFMDGCIKYNCNCHLNGSWECSARQTSDTCRPDYDRESTIDENRTVYQSISERSE